MGFAKITSSHFVQKPVTTPHATISFKLPTGFTLVELLIVIVIMLFLAGITVPIVSNIQTASKKGVTSAQISQLELAIRQFESDFGVFPPDSYGTPTVSLAGIPIPADPDLNTGSKCLAFFLGSKFTFNSTSFNAIYGPYIEFKKSQITGTGVNFADDTAELAIEGINATREVFQYKDPFGSFYSYDSSSPSYNVASFDIYSFGPDITDNFGTETSDDITNW
ncbi:MAG: Bacterial type II secretion system protein G [Candidatus Scalindua rubra]|uniref:Bacterial type II secretion system protein G n=1 Tax=Candidatus Scalindua rubra TaxID=1872076 RepID=A0A1E3X9V9_9BACT|nr:MAG: Bacterial type II secretion system protein G [Candidatus Scalindua rubra]